MDWASRKNKFSSSNTLARQPANPQKIGTQCRGHHRRTRRSPDEITMFQHKDQRTASRICEKSISSCALFGLINLERRRVTCNEALRAISCMSERGNGLGAGFAGYGIYPHFTDAYALHVMYLDDKAKRKVEKVLMRDFQVLLGEEIPTRRARSTLHAPAFWRYFLEPARSKLQEEEASPDEYVVSRVMKINGEVEGAYILSSGKDVGVFKGVGFPRDLAEFFRLEEYRGYMWICHARFPTNTVGWWGGAHPFNLLDLSVAHNGELSSYDVNRRYLEMWGYKCVMHTDSEVISYALDLLLRRHAIPMDLALAVLAPPYWDEIDSMKCEDRDLLTALRRVYGELAMIGPFSIIAARHGEMIGFVDRKKLRPLVGGVRGEFFYLSSEESAIRLISPTLDNVVRPRAGEAVIARCEAPRAVAMLSTLNQKEV
ncbi:MAG: glutamine amidotransferase family protein [Candidatus Nezhaarchaeota archaeon]|nr:glutamine amidotransferase family protein [Candidatus Nezhaarchaeota archaeon]